MHAYCAYIPERFMSLSRLKALAQASARPTWDRSLHVRVYVRVRVRVNNPCVYMRVCVLTCIRVCEKNVHARVCTCTWVYVHAYVRVWRLVCVRRGVGVRVRMRV